MNNGRKEYTLLWFIENYSYCWHKNGDWLRSPKFTIEGLERTAWRLLLYPRGYRGAHRNNISLFLCREANDAGPETLPLSFELSFLASDGSALQSNVFKFISKKRSGNGACKFLQMDEIHGQRKDEYLPNDTLSVRCKMWTGEGNVYEAAKISARTRMLSEKISFLHNIENFSEHQSNVKNKIQIESHSQNESAISSSVYFTDGSCCEKKLMIEIVPSDTKLILRKCELSLLDKSGNLIECGGTDFECEHTNEHKFKLPLSLTRKVILNKKSEYLPQDKLSLLCECTFSNGLRTDIFEETLYDIPLTVIKQKNNSVHSKAGCKAVKELSQYPNALEDLKAIYTDQCLTDVELKTKTKSFPAHKIVLCARSPVLKAMMTNDMKEKNTNCIHVDDLENDTVQQLLLFLYSDNLENLHWESATELYYASDKYQIGKLKAMCSSFLTESLNSSNASELLQLADTHNDSRLKTVVEDFILENEEQVFGSNSWEKLIETNPQLVIKTMHLKYKRKNETN